MAESEFPRGTGGLMDRNVPSQLNEQDLSDELEIELPDSERNRLSISAAVDYDINDTMTVTAGVGANSIHEGTNLPYGYALSGANYAAGLAFGLGFSAAF